MFSEYATEYRETRNNAWMWRPTLGSSKSKRLGSILRRSGSDLMNWQTNTRPKNSPEGEPGNAWCAAKLDSLPLKMQLRCLSPDRQPYVVFSHPIGAIAIAPVDTGGKVVWRFTPDTLRTIRALY